MYHVMTNLAFFIFYFNVIKGCVLNVLLNEKKSNERGLVFCTI